MTNIELLQEALPALLRGIIVTLQIALVSCGIGMTLGTILGLIQSSQATTLRFLVSIYTTVVRGTPMLIQILFVAYVLPQFGIRLPGVWAAIIAIGCNSSAYISQIIRSGIASVSTGQIEAAQLLGLSKLQITRYIVLPQAIRVVLPAIGNELITLVKDSSLASIIGVQELSLEGKFILSRTFFPFTVYALVALFYLLITTTLSIGMARLEKRMNRHVTH